MFSIGLEAYIGKPGNGVYFSKLEGGDGAWAGLGAGIIAI